MLIIINKSSLHLVIVNTAFRAKKASFYRGFFSSSYYLSEISMSLQAAAHEN